jgi:plasmid rolling circle replication initiator protein Rep
MLLELLNYKPSTLATPTSRPPEGLSVMIETIDNTLEVAIEQEQMLIDAKNAKRRIGRDVTDALRKSLKLQLEMVQVFSVLVERWREDTLTVDEHFELTHLTQESEKLKEVATRMSLLLAETERNAKNRTFKRA